MEFKNLKGNMKKIGIALLALISLLMFWIKFQPSEYDIRMEEALMLKKQSKLNVFDGYEEPTMPDSYENDRTLLGVDKNKNKLRDDLEIWINRFGKSYNERMALRQAVANLEYKLVAAEENRKSTMIHASNVSYTDFECVRFIFGNKKVLDVDKIIREMVINNRLRKNLMERYTQFTYSYESIVENPNLDEPYRACFFNIEDVEGTKETFFKSLKN